MTNLVDMARSNYVPEHVCRHCGRIVSKFDSRWLDRAGVEDCIDGRLHWGVPLRAISQSPLLRGLS